MSNQHTCLIPRNMNAVFRVVSWRIILNRFYFDGRHYTSTMQCLKTCWTLLKPCTMRSVSSHEGKCRYNTSLSPGRRPQHFYVCKCCDFVPAKCRLSMYYTQVFSLQIVTATWALVSGHVEERLVKRQLKVLGMIQKKLYRTAWRTA